jgi:Flp pilus assembly protein TadD
VISVGLTLPWLAERDLRAAIRIAPTDPLEALERLDRAADLNPLSPNPKKASGVILARQGRIDEAALQFREALERSPRDSYVELQLGVIESELGRPVDALDHLRRAGVLAPRDAAIREAVAAVFRGRRLDFDSVDRRITRDIDVRLGRE